MTFDPKSQIGQLELRAAEAAARVDAARARLGAVATELRAVEDSWSTATAESMTAENFAVLSARRELLMRSQNRARREVEAAEAGAVGVKQAFGQATRSLLDARDRLARAEYRGDMRTIAEASATIAKWEA